MKILLIQPPWYGFQNIVSRRLYLGLAYLAAILKENGCQVSILNGESFFDNIEPVEESVLINRDDYLHNISASHEVYQKIMKVLTEFDPELVGISFMTANAPVAYRLADRIKQYRDDLPLIAGGVHPTLLPDEPLHKGYFDYVVRGEGEQVLLELVNAIKQEADTTNIAGISCKRNGRIIHNEPRPYLKNLDEISFPAFHLLHEVESQPDACNGITATRGCPFECNFCASSLMWSRKVRFRSADNIVAEIEDRYRRLGITSFSFHDDTFTLRPALVEETCRKMLKLDFPIQWHCDTRGDTLSPDLLKLMYQAGCRHIYLGLESGSPGIQKQIKKNLSTEKVHSAVKMARRAGIITTVYFMAGFPDETEQDIRQSINVMKKLNPDRVIWSIVTPYPGTALWEEAEKRGLVNEDTNWEHFFHHFNQGSFFRSMPEDTWNNMLDLINREQDKFNNPTAGKMLWKRMKRTAANPQKILKYSSRLIKTALCT
ncbi:MAG: B12-binding domain-containing radical SAM protein [Sedimentisphaerales bacterium]|nr:B12-binding domain-containing radical SAM protein [Sedimentisphaerales bacterium]